MTGQRRKAIKMTLRNVAAVLCILGALISQINGASHDNSSTNDTNETPGHKDPPPLQVAKFDWNNVAGPLTIILWILLASLAKLGKVLICQNTGSGSMTCRLVGVLFISVFGEEDRICATVFDLISLVRVSFISQDIVGGSRIMVRVL